MCGWLPHMGRTPHLTAENRIARKRNTMLTLLFFVVISTCPLSTTPSPRRVLLFGMRYAVKEWRRPPDGRKIILRASPFLSSHTPL
jgi:hypothetical protein